MVIYTKIAPHYVITFIYSTVSWFYVDTTFSLEGSLCFLFKTVSLALVKLYLVVTLGSNYNVKNVFLDYWSMIYNKIVFLLQNDMLSSTLLLQLFVKFTGRENLRKSNHFL